MNDRSLSLTISKLICFSALLLTFVASDALAITQVLDLEQVAAKEKEGLCGDYIMEKVDVSTVEAANANEATVTIVNAERQTVTAKKLNAGQQGTVAVRVKSLDDKEPVKDLSLKLVELLPEAEKQVLEAVQTDDNGEAVFTRSLEGGSYQIAIECGTPVAAIVAPTSSATAGVAALGVAGATALAVGLSTNDSNGVRTERQTTPPSPQPLEQNPIVSETTGYTNNSPRPPRQQSASQSALN